MLDNQYQLYKSKAGESSLSEKDFVNELKTNTKFQENYKNVMKSSGYTDEAITTYFGSLTEKPKSQPQVQEQSPIAPNLITATLGTESVSTAPSAVDMIGGQKEIPIPITESQKPEDSNNWPTEQIATEGTIPFTKENEDAFGTIYSQKISSLAKTVGLGEKYSDAIVRSRINDPKFKKQIEADLSSSEYGAKGLKEINDKKSMLSDMQYYKETGHTPEEAGMTSTSAEKVLAQSESWKDQLRPFLANKNATLKEIFPLSHIIDQQKTLLAKDSDLALDYFEKQVINNPSFSATYKANILGQFEQSYKSRLLGVDRNSAATKEYAQMVQQFTAKYGNIQNYLDKNKPAYDLEVGQVKAKIDQQREILSKTVNALHDERSRQTDAMQYAGSGIGIGMTMTAPSVNQIEQNKIISDKHLTRVSQIFLNDVARISSQFNTDNKNAKEYVVDGVHDWALGTAKSVKQPLWDVEVATAIYGAVKKEQKGEELSQIEQTLLQSFALLSTAEQTIPKSIGFKVGEGTYTSLEFMANMILTSGIYAGAKATIKEGAEVLIQKMLKESVHKRVQAWLPEAAGMILGNFAIAPLQASFPNEIAKQLTGEVKFKDIERMTLDTSESWNKTLPQMAGIVGKAFLHSAVEVTSEAMGEYGPILLSKFIKNPKILRYLKPSAAPSWKKAAKWDGTFWEFSEEIAGNVMNLPVDGWDSFVESMSPKNLAITLISVAQQSAITDAGSNYAKHRSNKSLQKNRLKLQESLGLEEFKKFSEGLNSTLSLQARTEFIKNYQAQTFLTPEQRKMATAVAIQSTINSAINGSIDSNPEELKAMYEKNKISRLDALLTEKKKDDFEKIVKTRDEGIADPNQNNDDVTSTYEQARKALLASEDIKKSAKVIERKFRAAIELADEQTPTQIKQRVTAKMQRAADTPEGISQKKEAEHTRGFSFEKTKQRLQEMTDLLSAHANRIQRLKEIESELPTAKTSKLAKLRKEQTNLLAMTQETHTDTEFRVKFLKNKFKEQDTQQQLRNVISRDSEIQSVVTYTDKDGKEVKLNRSSELETLRQARINDSENIGALETERTALFQEDVDKLEGAMKIKAQEELNAYNEQVKKTKTEQLAAETAFKEKFERPNKTNQIAEDNVDDLEIGQEVVIHDRLTDADLRGKIIQIDPTSNAAIVEYESRPDENGETEKYQIAYGAFKNSSIFLFNPKETIHESRTGPEIKVRKTKDGKKLIYFKDQKQYDEFKGIYDAKKKRYFATEAGAIEDKSRMVTRWGVDPFTSITPNLNKNGWSYQLRAPFFESEQQTQHRDRVQFLEKNRLTKVDYVKDLQRQESELDPDQKISNELLKETGSWVEHVESYPQWLKRKESELRSIEGMSESRTEEDMMNELDREQRQVEVINALNFLTRLTSIKFGIVETDPTGRNRKGWQIGNSYIINLDRATGDTPLHEYSHPIIDWIFNNQKELFDSLYLQLRNSKDSRFDDIIQKVDRLYSDKSASYRQKEALVTALGMTWKESTSMDLSPFMVAVNRVYNVVRNWLLQVTGFDNIDSNTTIDQLASMIAKGRVTNKITSEEINESRIEPKFKGAMTFAYGKNKRNDVTSSSTFQAIENGERTATTRYESDGHLEYWKEAKIGDIIEWKDKNGKKILVEVTSPLQKLDPSVDPEIWSKKEGWSTEYFKKNVQPKIDQAWQIEYRVVPKEESTIKFGILPSTEKAYFDTMRSAFDEFARLRSLNAKLAESGEKPLSDYVMGNKAASAAIIAFKNTSFYKQLGTSEVQRAKLQMLHKAIIKMLKKQKSIIDEDGNVSVITEVAGVAATSEQKLEQFQSGVTPYLKKIVQNTGIFEGRVKLFLVDMFQPEFIIHDEKDFKNIESKYSDPKHKAIARAIKEEEISFDDYVSMVNFYGNLHTEERFAIILGKDGVTIYNQAMSVADENLAVNFEQHILEMRDPKNAEKVVKAIEKYNKDYSTRKGLVTEKLLQESQELLSAVTGFSKEIIDNYLNGQGTTKGLFFADGTAVPNGSSFRDLLGQKVFFKKDGKLKPQQNIAIVTSLLLAYRNNIIENDYSGQKPANLPIDNVINNFMTYTGGKYFSNLDYIIQSYLNGSKTGIEGSDVEGNRFSTFSLSHPLYERARTLADHVKNLEMKEYYKNHPMVLQQFNGFVNTETDNKIADVKLRGNALWLGMMLLFKNGKKDYQQMLGQFSDKTTVYIGNAPKIDVEENFAKALAISPKLNEDINRLSKIIIKYWTQLNMGPMNGEIVDKENRLTGMQVEALKFAREFAVNFTINMDALLEPLHGAKSDYEQKQDKTLFDMADMVKRAQVTISPGYRYLVNIKGGVKEMIKYVIADDYIMKSILGEKIEQLDGLNYASDTFMQAAQISSGTAFARKDKFARMQSIKAAVNYLKNGRPVLVKSHLMSISVQAESLPDGNIYQKIRDYMDKHEIDVLSFPSSAKKRADFATTKLFYQDLTPVSSFKEESGIDITKLLDSMNLSELVIPELEGAISEYETNRQADIDYMKTQGINTSFDQTSSFYDLRDAIIEKLKSDPKLQETVRKALAIRMNQGRSEVFHANERIGKELATAFAQAVDKHFKQSMIQDLDINVPSLIDIPRSAFYIQQDLRQKNETSPQDISSQLFTNMMALNGYDEFIGHLTQANNLQHDFIMRMMSGFKDIESVKQYLLWNTDPVGESAFYQMTKAWAIEDEWFQKQVISKLTNLVSRDVLDVTIDRQSSIEIPDLTGILSGAKKVMYEGVERVQLPECAVSIPNIRYALEFETNKEAVEYMDANKKLLTDLNDKDGNTLYWEIKYDDESKKWIVPGEPVLISRTPAGNLNCHTIARARFRLKTDTAFTMLDITSRRASGSDFDGDARYNWIMSRSKAGIDYDNTYNGSINKAFMTLVDEYRNPINLEMIQASIDTKVHDDLLKSLSTDMEKEFNPSRIFDIDLFRNRNMAGYNMKAITSNITVIFSYLKYFGVPGIVNDQYNVVKEELDNLLNMSFDNAKEPKIEQLGFDEETAFFFAYELMTFKFIDKATSSADAKRKVAWAVKKLVEKYSTYSNQRDKALADFIDDLREEKTDVNRSGSKAFERFMSKFNMRDKEQLKKFKSYMKIIRGASDLQYFNKIKGMRDNLPNNIMDYLTNKDALTEFKTGNRLNNKYDRFFDSKKIYAMRDEKPALAAIFHAMEFADNIFALIPGMNSIEYLKNAHRNEVNSLALEGRVFENTLWDSKREIPSLLSVKNLAYLLKLRDRSFENTANYLKKFIEDRKKIRLMTAEEQISQPEILKNFNNFLEILIVNSNSIIEISPSIKMSKISNEYLAKINQDFAILPSELKRAFAYYTLIQHGFSSSTKRGGFYGLFDTNSRIEFAKQDYQNEGVSALATIISKRVKEEFVSAAKKKMEKKEAPKVVDIKSLRQILKEEKVNLEYPEAQAESFGKLLQQIEGEDMGIPTERITGFMQRNGINSEEELKKILEGLKAAKDNIKYQFEEQFDGTELLLDNPEFFEFMFNHFKSIYPELRVFNSVVEFTDYIRSQTGRTEDLDLRAIGAAFANAVYIDPTKAQQDTFFHEVSHTYWDALPYNTRQKDKLRMLYGWNSGMTKKQTNSIDERIIHDIGLAGTSMAKLRFEGARLQLFIEYLKDFWAQVKSIFSLDENTQRQAKMYHLHRVMINNIWSGKGTIQSGPVADQMMKYQIKGIPSTTLFGPIGVEVDGELYTTADPYFNSNIQYLESKLEKARTAWHSTQFELMNNALNPNGTNNIGTRFKLDANGRIFIVDESNNIVAPGILESTLTENEFVNRYMANEERMSVMQMIFSNMTAFAINNKPLDDIVVGGQTIHLTDFISDPIAVFDEIKKSITDIKLKYGFIENVAGKKPTISVSSIVFDDQAKHVAYIDLIGVVDASGSTTIVRLVPTFDSFYNQYGNQSRHLSENKGLFVSGPMIDRPTSLHEKIRSSMVQFATLYNNMHKNGNSKNRVTQMVVVPILMNNASNNLVDKITIENDYSERFTKEDQTLGDRIMAHIKSQAEDRLKYNEESIEQEKTRTAKVNFRRKESLGAIQFLKTIVSNKATTITTHLTNIIARVGYGMVMGEIFNSNLGWTPDVFSANKDQRSKNNNQKLTLKIAPKSDGRGLLIYGSPGWGKSFAQEYHEDLYDSDTFLDQLMHDSIKSQGLLLGKSNQAKTLQSYSKSNPIAYDTANFGVADSGKRITYDELISRYHGADSSLNLLAFQLTALIQELRKVAIRNLSDKYNITSDMSIFDIRSILLRENAIGLDVDMLRIDTPYEELQVKIDQTLSQGKHVLTSTLMKPEFERYIDLKYDKIYRLVSDKNSTEIEDAKAESPRQEMHRRTADENRTNRIDYKDQKWISDRYELEVSRFKDDPRVEFTSSYASDDLFEEEIHFQKEKVTNLQTMWLIHKLQIRRADYFEAVKDDPKLSVTDFVNRKFYQHYANVDIKFLNKEAGINGSIRKEMGIHEGMMDDDEVVRIFLANKRKADKIWNELGTLSEFIEVYDNTNAPTEKMLDRQRVALSRIFDRIQNLDNVNKQGLNEIISGQITMNYIIGQVRNEANEKLAYRKNTIILAKLLKDPTISWIPDVDKHIYLTTKVNSWINDVLRSFPNNIKVNLKLDRAIDAKHYLAQSLVSARMKMHTQILADISEARSSLDALDQEITDSDRQQMIYRYGDKTQKVLSQFDGSILYEGDIISAQFGRNAYLSEAEARELNTRGLLSDAAVDYMNKFRHLLLTYDAKYQKQMERNPESPTFVPDVMSQMDYIPKILGKDTEFYRAIKDNYDIEIHHDDLGFINSLYAALNTTSEDRFVISGIHIASAELSYLEGKSLTEAKRIMFWPKTIKDEHLASQNTSNPLSVRDILKQRIASFEYLRDFTVEDATSKYVRQERKLSVQGGFNKGMILRTEMFHKANKLLLNSLISNYYVSGVSPFAHFVESKYDQHENTSPVMQQWVKKYINERIFKHTPEDQKNVKEWHRMIGVIVSLSSLGINPKSGISNLTQGWVQTLLLKPSAFRKGITRRDQIGKVINIMKKNYVGMIVEDISFKESDIILQKAMEAGFYITEKVENINQALAFLGQMTDEELSWYNEDGTPIDPDKKLSYFRIYQMESLVRKINGDYGHNRPLYSADPLLMELGRFKMGWWQSMMNNTFGNGYVDMFGDENRSLIDTATRGFQRLAMRLFTFIKPNLREEYLRNFLKKHTNEDIVRTLGKTPEEALVNKGKFMQENSSLAANVFKVIVNGQERYYAITPEENLTYWSMLTLELWTEQKDREYFTIDTLDKSNWQQLLRQGSTTAITLALKASTGYVLLGIMAGALKGDGGDDDKKKSEDFLSRIWQMLNSFGRSLKRSPSAFLYGFNHSSVKSLITGKDVSDPNLYKKYGSLSDAEYAVYDMFLSLDNYFDRTTQDILVPYNPTFISGMMDMTTAATPVYIGHLLKFGYYGMKDLATMQVNKYDQINLKTGVTALSGYTAHEVLQVMPFKYIFKLAYAWNNLDKKSLEFSQIYTNAMAIYKSNMLQYHGFKAEDVDLTNDTQKQVWEAAIMESASVYNVGVERLAKEAIDVEYDITNVGEKKVKKGVSKFKSDFEKHRDMFDRIRSQRSY